MYNIIKNKKTKTQFLSKAACNVKEIWLKHAANQAAE